MANYRPSLKTQRMTAVRDDIDSGTGPGTLEICTSGFGTVLAVVTLGDPCGTVSGDVLTLSGFPRSDTSADATGTPAVARIKESGGQTVVNNITVGTSNAELILNSLSISAGQPVVINSATLTHSP